MLVPFQTMLAFAFRTYSILTCRVITGPFAGYHAAELKIPGVLQWTATQVRVVSLHRTHQDTGMSHWI